LKLYNKGDAFDLTMELKRENALRSNGKYNYFTANDTIFPFLILSRKKNPKGYIYTVRCFNEQRLYKECHITHKELKRRRDAGDCERVNFSELEKMIAHRILLEK